MTLWSIASFAIKLSLVGILALMLAMSLWMLGHALSRGVVPETRPGGSIRTRAQTPLRYWLYVIWQVLFIAGVAVMINVFFHLGVSPD